MSNTTRLTALESNVNALEGKLDRLLSIVEATVAAPGKQATSKGKPSKGKPSKAAQSVTFKELQARLKAHKANGAIVAGVSVRQAIETGLMDADGNLPGASVSKPGKKGKKGKARKAAQGVTFKTLQARLKEHKAAGRIQPGVSVKQAVEAGLMDAEGNTLVAQVQPEAPAKAKRKVTVTEDHASQGPRDALGRITPKSEWALRESLADSGKFDRHEIDAIVKAGV